MIPSPDFYIKFSIEISEEVLRMGCLTVGFALAMWALVKMTDILFGKRTAQSNNSNNKT